MSQAPQSEEPKQRKGRRFYMIMTGVGLSVGIAVASSIAFATWTTDGSGTASDQALTAQTVTLAASTTPTADLFPGGSGAAQFTVTNPNPYAVQLTSISFTTVTSGDDTNCPAANLTVAATVNLASPITVQANDTSGPQSVPEAFTLSADAPDGCQGVVFTVDATASGTQES
jgi:hypothetical protein